MVLVLLFTGVPWLLEQVLVLAGELSHPLLRGPLSCCLVVSLFRTVEQPLELFLQRLGALVPEVSLLLTVVTMIILLFSVISHSDGSHIDLSVESHFHIIPVLRGVIIIDVWQNVILFGLNLHSRFHLCSMVGDIGTVVVVLPAVTHLILMIVIRPLLVWICIVGPVRGLLMDQGYALAYSTCLLLPC